jgi:hypothetical protein
VNHVRVTNLHHGSGVKPGLKERAGARLRPAINDFISRYYSATIGAMPQAIEIETINRCNNVCSFCPVNRMNDKREYMRMSDALVERLAKDLEASRYGGLLALFSNNEPLLDKRITDICGLFRRSAPGAHLYIWTNGLLLTEEIYLKLFDAGLDELVIDNYSDEAGLIEPVAELLKGVNSMRGRRAERFRSRTRVMLRKKTEVLTNRAGLAPNKRTDEYLGYRERSCALPFIQLVARPTGEVSLCCQDAFGSATLGDLKAQSVTEVWQGAAYRDVRSRLGAHGRKALPLCRVCDVSILYSDVLKRSLKRAAGLLAPARLGRTA